MKTYKAGPGEHIQTTAENMVKMANQYGCVVTSEFNEIPLDTAPGADPDSIVAAFNEACEERRKKWEASPEYAKQQQEAKERQARKDSELCDALAASPPVPNMDDKDGWQKAVDANSAEPYGARIVRYCDEWARIMEGCIARGETLEQCAERASRVADDDGITGFMYGCAVGLLAQCWVHGEQLRRWHNVKTQLRNEGEQANRTGHGARSSFGSCSRTLWRSTVLGVGISCSEVMAFSV